jgi:putative membrane protein
VKRSLLRDEWQAIVKNKKLLIPIIAILFIPVLYSGMFLWAFWDPYERLSDLPVAIINEDQGATLDEKELKLGNELIKKLKDNGDFKFVFLEKEEAYQGLEEQKYYLLIEIPKDFSKNATTLLNQDPKKLTLVYVPNEGFNFLSAQIGGSAIEKIKASLSEKVSETYAETMFGKVEQLGDGFAAASDGAKQINDGVLALKDGSNTLYDGTQALSTGLSRLLDGQKKLVTASDQLLTGNIQLASGISKTKGGLQQVEANLPKMVEGSKQLQTGAESLSTSLAKWQAGATSAADSAIKLNQGIVGLQQQLAPILNQLSAEQKTAIEAGFNQLAIGSEKLSAGNAQLASSAEALANGADMLSTKLSDLTKGQEQLQTGINQLATGSEQLDEGANKIVSGQQEFESGLTTFGTKFAEANAGAVMLAEGSGKLSVGNAKLADGTHELADKLGEGAKLVSSVKGNEKTYEMFASPVKVKNEKINKVPNYGTGFAPYFLSLGLFVGALLLSIVFPLREPATVPKNGLNWFTSKLIIIAGIGVIQAVIAVGVLLFALNIEVQSVPLFVVFAIITSLTFITLIQLLVTMLGDPGRFIAIIVLILQLTTSAGTFPLELIPVPLQIFNSVLPMTYTVQGFKAVISSGDFLFMWQNAGTLVIFTLVFMGCTITYFIRAHKRRFQVLAK